MLDIARDNWSRLTFDGAIVPVWSEDGQSVLYSKVRGAGWRLLRQAVTGGVVTTLMQDVGKSPLLTSIVPGNDEVIMSIVSGTSNSDIWVLEPDGQQWTPRILLGEPYGEGGGVVSPNGQWLAYASEELGRYEVYVTDYPGAAQKWQISNDGGVGPVWSRDGTAIYYRRGQDMMRANVETENDFQASRSERLFAGWYEGLVTTTWANYDVMPDDQGFIMVRPAIDQGDLPQINLVLNWIEELRQRL